MLKKVICIISVFVLTNSSTFAGIWDKTPYKFMIAGNSYTIDGKDADSVWLAARYDAAIAGTSDWPGLFEAIDSIKKDAGEPFLFGPYASSQEINLYEGINNTLSYAERLTDTAKHWQYVYAKHYLDSIGISAESLVVHVDENSITITQQADGSRNYDLSGQPYHKSRFSYQYWNNLPGDYFFPAGYVWLANGYNEDARNAIAYAYRRRFIEDSSSYGNGKAHYTAYFMDNQGRTAAMPRLYAYYTVNATSGGPTEVMDWIEQPGIEINDSATVYFDKSTRMIDDRIRNVLDSTTSAESIDRIIGFANIDKFSPTHLSAILPYVNGVSLENPIDYTKNPSNWQNWYAMADIMAAHPEVYICWMMNGDFLCSSNPSDWNYDSSRIYMTHYSFFLTVRDTNAYVVPHRFNKKDRWREIYEIDFGEPDAPAYEVSRIGSALYGSDAYIYVMRRDYSSGAFALLRTAHSQADYEGDSVLVDLGGTYREVSAYGDTSLIGVTSIYIKPYSGKIFVPANLGPCDTPPSIPNASSPASGAAVGTSPALCVTNSVPGACTDPVTYQFEIADDINFASIVRQSGWIGQGVSTTCFTTSAALNNGRVYYWRSRAGNGTSSSGWSTPRNFTTPNSPPSAPSGLIPADQDTTGSRTPNLVINNAVDPEGTPLAYYYEVCKRNDFSSPLAAQSGPIPQGVSTTTWQVNNSLENGSDYFWRTRAFDGIVFGNWMNTLSFTVNASITNDPPTNPIGYSPPSGAVVTYTPISLTWTNSTDPNGDQITYQVHLIDSIGAIILDSVSGVAPGTGQTTSYAPQITFENAAWYNWRVRAFDGIDYSGWMTPWIFYLDTLYGINQPPQTPELISPANFDTLVTLQISLIAAPSVDPESDPLSYDFVLSIDEQFSAVVESFAKLPDPGDGSNIVWTPSAVLSSGAKYYWSCRAWDGENYSAWAEPHGFWVFDFSVNVNQTPPDNLLPRSGSVISETQPVLKVSNVMSSLADNLYYFEVSLDTAFNSRILSGPVEEEPAGETTWEVATPLESNRVYYWRTRANNSPYSEVSSFTIDAPIFMAPNPYQPYKGHQTVDVPNMGPDGKLTITTLTNEIIRVLTIDNLPWNVTSASGAPLASDIYLCYYKDGNISKQFKFVVIR